MSSPEVVPDKTPPGSLGLPLIGQSLSLLKALKADKVEEWFQVRITKHGPIWKTGLFGYPTVVLHGTAVNKFVYTRDGNVLSNTQPPSISRILGRKNILELVNDDHKRVRAALVSFLRLEVLKQYATKVDEEIQYHLQTHWVGKNEVKVQTLIKTLTFNVICSLLFGIERGPKREKLLPPFQDMIEGVLAIPVNLPFTQFNRGIVARKKLVPMLIDLIREKREAIEKQKRVDPHKDLITSLLSIRDNGNSTMMSDEEIIDNIIIVMIAGYDTTSVLLTFLVRLLATNESIYSAISREQEEVAKNKACGEALTWEDLMKMKYTWRVASEILRINPPVILAFRRAVQDIEYGGYIIPKGWQVLLSQSMTHMDNNIFQNPTLFNPARFEKNAPSPPPYSFVAFGGGPRMCPGIELAKMETLAMVHRLVTQFTWVLVNKDEAFKRIPMPEFDNGLLVQVMPVKATSMPSEATIKYSDKIPPGSLGLPLIGQSLSLLKALKADKVEEWFQERITKHGPIWKTGLFGYPTVVLHGTIANKFVYTCDGNVLSNTQPPSSSRIMGRKNIVELVNDDHKRVRAALVSFLRLEVLKQYATKVDEEIQYHLQTHWAGKNEVKVQTLIKTLTFNVICSLLFGIERGPKREKLLPPFQDMIEGVLAIPVNLPFTQFNRGIVARKKLVPMLIDLIREKREAIEKQKRVDPHKDLITSLLSIRDDDNSSVMSDEEIIDNIIIVMIAGYDTTSVLLTFLVRLLATNESIYSAIAREQEEVAKNKACGEALTWEDLTKMKYTWRVASELMRINPPVILSFRRAVQDIEYGGYIIPKGWQVLVSQSMTHMDNNIFQNPTLFNPARFEKNAPSLPPYSFVAFGGGPRMCPGIELAKMETLAMVHRLVTQFTWVLVNKDETFKRIPMPEFDNGLLVRIMSIKATSMPSEARI
ncbi:hypothetical protein OSB04_002212 [Centaurea solstitialis]|uniref:Cytochrome P450 n=1 Tax=Centaurea solstitialis TaxID=347529 RepID=A0AA38U330_9ASTR|nr:hypothetical protein OSB04_002212 [Centaurea solstitialis]